jgi:hypothetical protein
VTDRELLFAFETPEAARIFVHRLVLSLRHLAIYIAHEHVHVIDGSDEGQREEILKLARSSSATLAAFHG